MFVCSLCEKSYSRKDYLDRHIKATHQEHENEEGILSSFLPGPTNPKRMKMTQKCEIEDRTEELSDINQMVEVKLEAEDEDEDEESESFSETRGNNIKAELQVWSLNIVCQFFMLNSEHMNHLFVCRAKQSFQMPSLQRKTSYLSKF